MATALDTYLNDPTLEIHYYHHHHPHQNTQFSNQMTQQTILTSPSSNKTLTPIQTILSLPPPILSLLAQSQPIINSIASISLIIRWSHPSGHHSSWILLFTWSFICLSTSSLLQFGGFNLILTLTLSLTWLRSIHQIQSNQTTDQSQSIIRPQIDPTSLINTLDSFQIIVDHAHLISITIIQPIHSILHWSDYQTSKTCLYASITSLPFTLLLTRFLGLQTLFLIIGSIIILWSAPWFTLFRKLIWRSRILRFGFRVGFRICLLGGIGVWDEIKRGTHHGESIKILPLKNSNTNPDSDEHSTNHDEGLQSALVKDLHDGDDDEHTQEIEIRFTIFENQRWWMGLDWTNTLLPHERPNWTDSSHTPVPGPTDFKLPNTTITLSGKKITWKWIDQDWLISKASPGLINNESTTKPNQLSSPLRLSMKSILKSSSSNDINGIMNRSDSQNGRSGSISFSQSTSSELEKNLRETMTSSGLSSEVIVEGEDPSIPWDVDSNGWQYGDNHWEKLSRKAGIGRYTRRRAWVRRAVMISTDYQVQEEEEEEEEEEETEFERVEKMIPSTSSKNDALRRRLVNTN
ncbi:Peroxin/Dysferlin domain-containing protein [Melampsora americana]|nr:Peroxin/Dysferlin domain-containing protein [Melampsora americana]